jgi:enoyl-[acyl-carrier-protein] reductase (NADH)
LLFCLGLQNQLRGAELVADVLKESLTTASSPLSPQEVNDLVIRKTLGGPKRFRPKTREELQNQVNDLELKYKRAFANGEKTKQRLRDSQRENSTQRLNQSNSSNNNFQEGKMSHSNSYGSKTEEGKSNSSSELNNKPDHGARVVELLGQLEEMRAQTEVKDRQIRMYVSKVEGLHESKRELMGYKEKYERSKLKNQQQLNEIESMHGEEIKLRRLLERTKETALRLEAEVDVQKEEGMVANQDVGRQRLKDMQKISELTEDLSDVRAKLDVAEKAAAFAHQKRLKGTQTLETNLTSLKRQMKRIENENTDFKNENVRLQQRLDREMEENKKTIASTTSSTGNKIAEQERKIKKLTIEKEDAMKELVRHETASKNFEAQLDREGRANSDRMDKLESLLQAKESELRSLEKERADFEYKSQDAKRSAKEIESRGESGLKAAMEELNDVRSHLDEETHARQELQNACKQLQTQLSAAKTKIRKLQKSVDQSKSRNTSTSSTSGAGRKTSGGPAKRTPAKVEDGDEDDEDDLDSIMNA